MCYNDLIYIVPFSKDTFLLFDKVTLSSSSKDRIVYPMLLKNKINNISNDYTIIEATSGNTGISLAYFSKVMNFNPLILLPNSASVERINILKSLDCKTLQTKGSMKDCFSLAQLFAKSFDKVILLNQFHNPYGLLGSYSLGKNIDSHLQNINIIIVACGTYQTITGLAMYVKRHYIGKLIISVKPSANEFIEGITSDIVTPLKNDLLIDNTIYVNREDMINKFKKILKTKYICLGESSCACLCARDVLLNKYPNAKILIICPDDGSKYLSKGLLNE